MSDFDDLSSDEQTSQTKESITDTDFLSQHDTDAGRIAEILNIHRDVAFLLLQAYNFDSEQVMEEYTTDKAKCLEIIGVPEDKVLESLELKPAKKSDEKMTCQVCFDECDSDCMLSLICGHLFCRQCWKVHIDIAIRNAIVPIRCMESNCKCILMPRDIGAMCDTQSQEKYTERINDRSVSKAHTVKRCANKSCNLLISIDSITRLGTVKCPCGTETCWHCNEEFHFPCSCEFAQTWRSKWSDVVDSLWIRENTKMCPKCHVSIEKNGGCNHMTCGSCQHEFCWICGHDWATHPEPRYDCLNLNTNDEWKIDGDLDPTAARLFVRYAEELRGEKDHRAENREILMNHRQMSRELAELLLDLLADMRLLLMWSFPYAKHGLDSRPTEQKLFEFVQQRAQIELEKSIMLLDTHIQVSQDPKKRLKLMKMMYDALVTHVIETTEGTLSSTPTGNEVEQ